MFEVIKKMFIGLFNICLIKSFRESLVSNSNRPMKYLTLNNQLYQARPALVTINSDETLFYLFTVSANKYGGSCNTINEFVLQMKLIKK